MKNMKKRKDESFFMVLVDNLGPALWKAGQRISESEIRSVGADPQDLLSRELITPVSSGEDSGVRDS